MNYIIETNKLTKKYGDEIVVDDVNLHIPNKKIYALLGRNGAGKTTIMKMMLDLVKVTSGEINIHMKKNEIGSIIETPSFYGNLTAYENLKLVDTLRRTKSVINKALVMVGLDNEDKKVFSSFSLGMKQRLGIAAAIMHKPKLLILDEPINGLDPIGITKMRELLLNLCKNENTTILISSHVLSEIEQIADVIGVINEGKLILEESIESLNAKNSKYTEFIVSDTKKASEILEKRLCITKYKICNEGCVRIFQEENSVNRGEINRLLVENGITVSDIVVSKETLEEYFSELIGGGNIG